MTWTQMDDGLNQNPVTEPDALGNAALGLLVRLCVFTASQMRFPEFDGTFDLRRVKALHGTARQIGELLESGLLAQDGDGRYRVVPSDTVFKFSQNRELHAKRVESGRKGGKASGRARRSRRDAADPNACEAFAPPSNEANASSNNEAHASPSLEATGPIHNHNQYLTTPNPSEPEPEPEPGPGPEPPAEPEPPATPPQTDDGFTPAWNAYPRHTGSRDKTHAAWRRALAGVDGRPPVTPERLMAAVLAYRNDIGSERIRYAPNMSRWLDNGQYTEWLPKRGAGRGYEWGGISREWIREHIERRLPVGAFSASLEQTFWASVKSGMDAGRAAEIVVGMAVGR